jgi:mono/diheme cytochrome c family protein
MSLLYVKSVTALFFLGAGVLAITCMLALMGRSDRKVSAAFLRTTHKVAGVVFTVLLAVLTYLCLAFVVAMGDQLSLRAVLHSVLALGLIAVLLIKILIVQYYRKLMVYVPALGMVVFALAFVVFFTSAGYYFLRSAGMETRSQEITGPADQVREMPEDVAGMGGSGEMPEEVTGPSEEVTEAPKVTVKIEGNAATGEALFDTKCSFCHSATSEDPGFGPGLKGLLKKDSLPSTGRPATVANVVDQLKAPVGVMPPFASLSEQELRDLIAFLETL